MLAITNLHASVGGAPVLRGIDLTINAGEVHAIMGPNGSGKSTLSKIIAGHPDYEVTSGAITYTAHRKTKDLLDMEPEDRAREGIFLAFQYPTEIPGISNTTFLREAFNAICKHQGVDPLEEEAFLRFLRKKMDVVGIDEKFLERHVNVDFSGGEKKRNEILQMAVLSPKVAFLDETDSGLDVDSLRIVAEGVNKLKSKDNVVVLITHYQRILNYIVPDFVHILYQGRIVRTGGKDLALHVEEHGYDGLI